MSPPGVKEKSPPLDLEVHKTLGSLKAPVVAEHLRLLANQAMEYQEDEAQKLLDQYNLPIDLTDLTEVLETFDPNKLVNEFHWMNPQVDLQNLLKQPPLQIFEDLVKMLTKSDRYNSLK
jgi:hypothetical protein